MVADADLGTGQIVRPPNLRLRRDVDAGRRDRVGVAPHLAVIAGRGHVDGPMAGGADVASAAGLHRLEGALRHLGRCLVRRLDPAAIAGVAVRGGRPPVAVVTNDIVAGMEDILEALVLEIPLLVGDPLLKPIVRLDLEDHRRLLPSPPLPRKAVGMRGPMAGLMEGVGGWGPYSSRMRGSTLVPNSSIDRSAFSRPTGRNDRSRIPAPS